MDVLVSFHIPGLHPQHRVLRQGFALVGFRCTDVERCNTPPAGPGQADGHDALGVRVGAQGLE